MKTIFLTSLIGLIGLITILNSCKEKDEIKVSEITNVWRLEEVYVNGQLQDSKQMPVTHLGIQEDNKYFRGYVTGTWTLSDDRIKFKPIEDFVGLPISQHQILEHSKHILILESSMTEKEYLWDFANIADDEVITIREKFVKN